MIDTLSDLISLEAWRLKSHYTLAQAWVDNQYHDVQRVHTRNMGNINGLIDNVEITSIIECLEYANIRQVICGIKSGHTTYNTMIVMTDGLWLSYMLINKDDLDALKNMDYIWKQYTKLINIMQWQK